jgi:hypothetical protein
VTALLRQPGGFQARSPIFPEVLDAHDLAVVNRAHVANRRIDAHFCVLRIPDHATEDNHLVGAVQELLRLNSEVVPRLPQLLQEPLCAFIPAIDLGIDETSGELEGDVRVAELAQAGDRIGAIFEELIPCLLYASAHQLPTFSSDIAYSDSPAALRASARFR